LRRHVTFRHVILQQLWRFALAPASAISVVLLKDWRSSRS